MGPIIMKMKVMDELKDIGSKLTTIKRELPFSVPDGYFDHFQTRLEGALHTRKSKVPLRSYILRPYMAAAVLLIIALLAGTMIFRINHGSRAERRFTAELSHMVELELYSMPEETILEIMTSVQANHRYTNSASSDDMIDYLLNEDLNEEELLNNL